MHKNEFIKIMAPLAQAEAKKRGSKFVLPSICIAQAALETGWGSSRLMTKANAFFGIKATSSWKGKVYNAKTKECYDGVNLTDTTAFFRAYDRLEDSVADYYNLITGSSRYAAAVGVTDATKCITAIKNGGYATDTSYVSKVMAIVNSNNLTQYDSVVTSASATTTPASKEPNYQVGKTYTLQVELKVRTGAGTNYSAKKYSQLTTDGKKHDKDGDGALDKGTVITCKEVKKNGADIWIKCPSGWLAAYYQGNIYIK